MELHYRYERRICAKKREGVSIVKRRKGGSLWVYKRIIEEELLELKMIDLVSILFSFTFLLFSLIFLLKSRRKRRQSVTLSQKSHTLMIQGNNVEDSGKMMS